MTDDVPTDEIPHDADGTGSTAPGLVRVVDLREPDPLPHALLREAYEERLLLFARGAGEEELAASALRVQALETALRPARRLPRRTLEPSIFLG